MEILNTEIEQKELKKQLLYYVDYQSKTGFPFGELLILHYEMFEGKQTKEIYKVAAALELLILSSDILDDFEDGDGIHKPWSVEPKLSLNSTTALLFVSTKVLVDTNLHNKNEAVNILLKYGLQSINGQHKDLLNNCKTEESYIEMTLEKSGSLTKLACLLGTVLATRDYPKEIKSYSRLIGLIGQINNDLEDIMIWDEENDLLNRRYTLPIIYLLNRKEDNLQIVRDYYYGQASKEEVIEKQQFIGEKLISTGAINYTKVIKRIQQNKVLEKIRNLDVAKEYLTRLKKYVQ